MLKGRHNRQRRARPRTQTFNRLIPNIITVGALCAGLTAVRFAIAEQWEFAMVAVVVAAILDALDGTIARLLKAASDFGAELDSLSDVIAFGVAPGLIIYFWSLSEIGGVGWAAGLFFAVCCALRLARFNSTLETRPRYANNFFTGVPAPGGALLALLPLLMSREFGDGFFRHPAVTGPWIVLIALLMVSQIPTYSLKRLRVPQRYFLPMLVLIGLLGAGLAGAPWHTLLILSLVYLGSFPFSYRSFKRLKAESGAEENDVDESETEAVNKEGGDERPSTHLREV
ncbi:MAG: CDP-diacylglycerol--serine O-phosphatidyltransferase [Pseudomonadota bacterium]|nr:CDP-diacylglycerol--serine O-phosphatidyltransferase [Pseudomonadota bacterium]